MRLIDADAVHYSDTIIYGRTLVEKATIDKMPTIEAEPEKYGRWEASEWGWPDRSVHCSECGFTRDDGRGPKWKRCPICEIKMKTEE